MAARIVVGIGGGIAAYKVATVVSRLVQGGHQVDVVLTAGATQFIGAATFTALCGRPAVVDTYDSRFPLGPHIELAEATDLLVIAPATARLMASCAHGLADDLLSTLYLACEGRVLMAPAMSSPMWEKPAVQRNLAQLLEDGVTFIGPEKGWLSCRKQGWGRMAEPEQILKAIEEQLGSGEQGAGSRER
jgi:phosphopantothenoylcysteine decarboxylase